MLSFLPAMPAEVKTAGIGLTTAWAKPVLSRSQVLLPPLDQGTGPGKPFLIGNPDFGPAIEGAEVPRPTDGVLIFDKSGDLLLIQQLPDLPNQETILACIDLNQLD